MYFMLMIRVVEGEIISIPGQTMTWCKGPKGRYAMYTLNTMDTSWSGTS